MQHIEQDQGYSSDRHLAQPLGGEFEALLVDNYNSDMPYKRVIPGLYRFSTVRIHSVVNQKVADISNKAKNRQIFLEQEPLPDQQEEEEASQIVENPMIGQRVRYQQDLSFNTALLEGPTSPPRKLSVRSAGAAMQDLAVQNDHEFLSVSLGSRSHRAHSARTQFQSENQSLTDAEFKCRDTPIFQSNKAPKLFQMNVYELLPEAFEKMQSLLISVNLIFGATLWSTPAALYSFIYQNARLKKVWAMQKLLSTRSSGLGQYLKKLIYVRQDNMVLGIEKVMHRKKTDQISNVILLGIMMQGLNVSRLIIHVSPNDDSGSFYIFTEQIDGKFCMDGRFMRLLDPEAEAVDFVSDITKVQKLLEAKSIQFYALVQEYPEKVGCLSSLRDIMRKCAQLFYYPGYDNSWADQYLQKAKNVNDYQHRRWMPIKDRLIKDSFHIFYFPGHFNTGLKQKVMNKITGGGHEEENDTRTGCRSSNLTKLQDVKAADRDTFKYVNFVKKDTGVIPRDQKKMLKKRDKFSKAFQEDFSTAELDEFTQFQLNKKKQKLSGHQIQEKKQRIELEDTSKINLRNKEVYEQVSKHQEKFAPVFNMIKAKKIHAISEAEEEAEDTDKELADETRVQDPNGMLHFAPGIPRSEVIKARRNHSGASKNQTFRHGSKSSDELFDVQQSADSPLK